MTVIDHRAFSLLHSHSRDARSRIRFQQEKVLRRKLDNLYCNQTWDFRRSNRNRVVADQELDKVVVNLSSTTLTSVEKNVFSKGLNFIPTPKVPPFLDIIASTEMSLTKTEPGKAAEIKGIISSSLLQLNRMKRPTSTAWRET
ncbi:hypothetical protein M514_18369 [Trichuris suis]|uniref:Uncharacterized protein n=1 Tax=Trichuris suis TaxID=68888 RepID=A0A085NJ51_9BILA|nr:hypothetical protein M514_18369 [Trichuris suis]